MVGPDLAVAASNVLLGTATGAGVSQSLFVMPQWFSSPPESLAPVRERKAAKFWVPLQLGALVALGAAFALNRRDAARRRLLLGALGCYAVTWISTGAYFAPEIVRLSKADGDLPAGEIVRRGRRWMNLTWLRHAAMLGAWALTLPALAHRPSARALRRPT
jgi:Domain of unknown function (DUF1772)